MGRLYGQTFITHFAFNIIPQTLYKVGLRQLESQQGVKVANYTPQQMNYRCIEVYRRTGNLVWWMREVAGIDETNIDAFIETFCVVEQNYGNLLTLLARIWLGVIILLLVLSLLKSQNMTGSYNTAAGYCRVLPHRLELSNKTNRCLQQDLTECISVQETLQLCIFF